MRRRPGSHVRTRRSESAQTRAPGRRRTGTHGAPARRTSAGRCRRCRLSPRRGRSRGARADPVQYAVLRSAGHVRAARAAVVPADPGANRGARGLHVGRHVRESCHQRSARRNGKCLSRSDRDCPDPGGGAGGGPEAKVHAHGLVHCSAPVLESGRCALGGERATPQAWRTQDRDLRSTHRTTRTAP